MPMKKGSLGWPARLVLRARRYSRNSGGGRTTVAPGTGGRGYLRQLFYDGSRSLPPFFGWRQARGWIAGRALRGQRAGPGGRAAERGRVGAPTGPGRSTCGWAKERAMARKMGPGDGKGDLLDLGNPLTRFFLCCFIYYKKDSHHNRRKACVYKDAGIPGGGL